MNDNNESGGRLDVYAMQSLLLGLLTIAFTVLKLCGVIKWSWWWVLAPIWIPSLLLVGILIIIILVIAHKERKSNEP